MDGFVYLYLIYDCKKEHLLRTGQGLSILGITCLRDDGPYCAEWIAHHLAAGIDRMLVITHDCSDGSDTLLNALMQDPRILHLDFTPKGKKSVQWQALKIVQDHPWYQDTDWALFFDCDEFLCGAEQGLPEILRDLENTSGAFDAVALPWRLFGTSGLRAWTDGLTPERFTQAAPADLHFPLAHLFKTIFRPKAFAKPGVHRPRAKLKRPARWITPDGTELPENFARADAAITLYSQYRTPSPLCLNHYSIRSEVEFLLKRKRGLPNHVDREIGLTYWVERNWNTVKDTAIAPMLPATRKTLAQLMALPNVAELHAASRNHHRAAIKDMLPDIGTLRLQYRLRMHPTSTPPTADEGRAFVAAQRAAFAQKGP